MPAGLLDNFLIHAGMHMPALPMTNFQPVPERSLPAASCLNFYDRVPEARKNNPAVSLCCRDIGLDCSFEATGETRPLTMREFIRHAEASHNMQVLSAEVLFKIKDSLK
jgi:predicted small metal-binding protein